MAGLGFVGSIVFARELGPAGYGTFYLVLTLVQVLDNPVAGWGIACKKRLSESDFPTAEAIGSGLTGSILNSLVVLPGVYVFATTVNAFEIRELLVPFSVLYISFSLFTVSSIMLSGRANFAASEWVDTFRSLLTLPLQLLLAVVLSFGAVGMIYGLAAATLCTVPIVLHRIGVRPELPSLNTVRRTASYAKFSILDGFIGSAQSRVDILLLGAILATTDAIGHYEIALKLTIPALLIADVTGSGLLGRVSNLLSRGEPVEEDVTNALAYAGILAVPIFFGALAIPEPLLVTIYGGEFRSAAPLLAGLACYHLVRTQVTQFTAVVSGFDRPDVKMWVSAISLVTNVVLGYTLLRMVGPVGVVFATIFSECLKYVALGYVVKRELPAVRLIPRPVFEQLGAGVVMYVCVEWAHQMIAVRSWVELSVLLFIGGLTYFTVLTVASPDLRGTVRGIVDDARTN